MIRLAVIITLTPSLALAQPLRNPANRPWRLVPARILVVGIGPQRNRQRTHRRLRRVTRRRNGRRVLHADEASAPWRD
jgi:hypothetical protein